MAHFTSHTPDTAPDGSKTRLAEVGKAWGFVPKLHGNLAESPVALEAYDTLFGLVAKSTLSPVEQQVAYQAINVSTNASTASPATPICPAWSRWTSRPSPRCAAARHRRRPA